jgi:hypothetical protein
VQLKYITLIQKYAPEDWVKLYLALEPHVKNYRDEKSWKKFYIPFFAKHPVTSQL